MPVRGAHTEEAGRVTLSGDSSLALPEFDAPPEDPVELFRAWLDAADEVVREPRAAALATADDVGQPSSRIVLLKDLSSDGALTFTTHHDSRKGRDLQCNPSAAMTLYWRETLQQVNIAGRVERVDDEVSDACFAERPAAAQATTTVSQQGRTLRDEQALHERAAQLVDAGEPLVRPATWGGYRLDPTHIEFWHGSTSRLHRRLAYARSGDRWLHRRLQP